MNSAYKVFRVVFFNTILLLICTNIVVSQEIPVPYNHLVNKFLERQITLGNLSQSDMSVRPFTYSKVRGMLKQLSSDDNLMNKDLQLLRRFESEFSIEKFEKRVVFPMTKSALSNIGKQSIGTYKLYESEPHFLSYRDSSVFAWADFEETIRIETINNKLYRRFTDQFSILGSISDQLSFYVNFTMNRFVGDSSLVYQIENFKNEDHPYFDFVNWTLWYQSEAAFNIATKYGNFKLGKTPVIWGFSPKNSSILSGSTQTFSYISYSYRYKNIGFNFIHGSLLPYDSDKIHLLKNNPQKYLAAHRIELDINKDLTISFNEMVIYGNRPIEIEYLIPVNFYWAAEHNQGDRDNLLMALDCSWRIKPGLRLYNTLFWDELAWEKVLTKWWANKFIFQTGIHWVSKSNPYLMDLRAEATVSRPWTYTHNELVNSYTSAGIGLGLPQGPNSQSLLLEAGFWPTYRWYMNVSSLLIRQGSGLGSSPLDNYDLRNRDLDDNTPYLLGDVENIAEMRIETHFALNRIVNLLGYISYNYPNSELSGNIGIMIDW